MGSFSGAGDLFSQSGGSKDLANSFQTETQLYPKPSMSDDKQAWRDWQRELGDHLRNRTFELNFAESEAPPASLVAEQVVEQNALTRREFTLLAADGDLIPVVALIPAGASEPLPGIIMLAGHVKDRRSGLAQMVLPGRSINRSAALQLALAGFVTFTIELPGFGLRGSLASMPDHQIVAYNEIQTGGFYKKKVMHEIKRLVDYIETMPEVDHERLGISGVSLGGRLAVAYGGLDNRIKAVSFHMYGGQRGPFPEESGTKVQPHYCQIIPGHRELMHREDPLLLLAPRPTQGLRSEYRPFKDSSFARDLEKIWTLMGKREAIEISTMPEGRYLYFVDEAIRFFESHLQSRNDTILDHEV